MITFTVAAIYLLQGKGTWMIAGYNIFSKTEKSHYDEPALCKFTGKLLLSIVFAVGLLLLGDILQSTILRFTSLILIVAISIFGIIYMNTKERFKK